MSIIKREIEIKFKIKNPNFIRKKLREKNQLKKIVKIFGLNFEDKIIGTYWDLWKEYCEIKGVRNKNITFSAIKT